VIRCLGVGCLSRTHRGIGRVVLVGFVVMVVLISISALWFLEGYLRKPSEEGFGIYSLKDNTLMISDADILSYNWTSQEMAITAQASERLNQTEDLYSFSTGFAVRIDGVEVYRGIFREITMNAIPAPPKISIIFPSVIYPSGLQNYGAIRWFFPFFRPPSDQPANNAKILHYFEKVQKLVY
jgi:hypothetical protein